MTKLITVSENLLKEILPHLKNTPLEKKINDLIENTGKYQTQNISYFPKKGKVERVVDGDTNDHSKYHSPNAFCGYAGPEEMQHLQDLIDKLTDDQLKQLVENLGLSFMANEDTLEREDYEGVVTESNREDFYREYRKIAEISKKK